MHAPSRSHRLRLPAFHPVPLRGRSDGWTPRKQAAFIGHLAETRSVRAAAEAVGMCRETAYRLRRRPGAEGFAAAWDRALGRAATPLPCARKVTLAALRFRIEHGRLRAVLHRGRFSHVEQKADNSALLALLARYDRAMGRGRQANGAARHKIAPQVSTPLPCDRETAHLGGRCSANTN